MASIELPVLGDELVDLRSWRDADAMALEAACGDPLICRFTTVPARFTVREASAWIARQHDHARRGSAAVLAIVVAGEQQPVGMVGLFGLDEPGTDARFGYWLVAHRRGEGLALAATRLVVAWGFGERRLTTIFIDREPDNLASATVAAKLGAAEVGSHTRELDGLEVQLVRHALTVSANDRRGSHADGSEDVTVR